MAEHQYICKRCDVSRDYDSVDKKLDPRKGERGTICEPCWSECMAELASDNRTFSRPLVGAEAPYQRASETSKAAAKAVAHKIEGQALQVLTVISEAPEGLTEPQITMILDMERNESTRAISGLHMKTPYVEKADFKRVNPASGQSVQVYIITNEGRAFLAASKLGRAA